MGLIRILIIFLCIYFVLRYIQKRLSKLFFQSSAAEQRGNNAKVIEDKIVPCPTCGTYNPTKEAYAVGDTYYCNSDCYQKKGES